MALEMSREILQRYFSNITYIDDQFDHCFIQHSPITEWGNTDYSDDPDYDMGDPPLTLPPEDISETAQTENGSECPSAQPQDNLLNLLSALNQVDYSNIVLTPVLYSKDAPQEMLCQKIMHAPLTLIDWNLGLNATAFPLINKIYSQSRQLKVIVVYTASFPEAKKELDSQEEWDGYKVLSSGPNLLCCTRSRTSLLILADKQQYSILDVLKNVVEVYLDTYGVMPVALLDYMNRVQKSSDDLFSAFSLPLESLFHLQIVHSGFSDLDISSQITEFIQNRMRDECKVSSELGAELFTNCKQRLEQFAQLEDTQAQAKLNKCINRLASEFSGEQKVYIESLHNIGYTVFHDCCSKACNNSSNWEDFYAVFKEFFSCAVDQIAECNINKKFANIDGLNSGVHADGSATEEISHSTDDAVISKIKRHFIKQEAQAIKTDLGAFFEQLTPLFVQLLISSDELFQYGNELLHNIKYITYSSTDLNTVLQAGRELGKKKKGDFLLNKLHFGDILVNGEEYLLCLTPPCDTFRPEKTELNIMYIMGKEIPKGNVNNVSRRENIHISALPIEQDGQKTVKYIKWKYYRIVRFDLADPSDYNKICTYSRPYRMAESYARQISNKFTAYFARAGVDEIFFKEGANLRKMFS